MLLVAVVVAWRAAQGLPQAVAHASTTRPARAAKARGAAPANPAPVSFRAGETLNYRVAWSMFSSAASVELTVPEQRDLFGWKTWHFRAAAHTLSTVRSLFPVDDQFDSYSDATALTSRQYELHLNELGRKEDQVLHLVTHGQQPRPPGANVEVLLGTRDPLGALYALRDVDWQRIPEFRAPVYDGRDLYEMRAMRESASEAITAAGGQLSASRVAIRVFQHDQEISAIRFAVWFSNDSAHAPVVIQAQLPFGNLRAELTSISR